MAIITLTTDFGEKDHFAGAIKGAIYSELPDVKIVDISHSISPFNISEAAYIIQNAFRKHREKIKKQFYIDSVITIQRKYRAYILQKQLVL